jgi:hypothetical protein
VQVLHDTELWLREQKVESLSPEDWREIKSRGFSDAQLARFMGSDWLTVRDARKAAGVVPTYKRVDTCAAEFAAETPYLYSCYDDECEAAPTSNPKVRWERVACRGVLALCDYDDSQAPLGATGPHVPLHAMAKRAAALPKQ